MKVSDPAAFKGDDSFLIEFEYPLRRYIDYHIFNVERARSLISFYIKDQAADLFQDLHPQDMINLNNIFTKLKDRFCSTFCSTSNATLI